MEFDWAMDDKKYWYDQKYWHIEHDYGEEMALALLG